MNIFLREQRRKKIRRIVHISLSLFCEFVHLTVTCLLLDILEIVHFYARLFYSLAYQIFYTAISIISNCVSANALTCHAMRFHPIVRCTLCLSAPTVTTYFALTLINWISSSMWFEKVRIRKSKCFWNRKCFVHSLYTDAHICDGVEKSLAWQHFCCIFMSSFLYSCHWMYRDGGHMISFQFVQTQLIGLQVQIILRLLCKYRFVSPFSLMLFFFSSISKLAQPHRHTHAIYHTVMANKFQFNICK